MNNWSSSRKGGKRSNTSSRKDSAKWRSELPSGAMRAQENRLWLATSVDPHSACLQFLHHAVRSQSTTHPPRQEPEASSPISLSTSLTRSLRDQSLSAAASDSCRATAASLQRRRKEQRLTPSTTTSIAIKKAKLARLTSKRAKNRVNH